MNEYPWLVLAKLLQRNYSLKEALPLVSASFPKKKVFARLSEGLKQGMAIKELLGDESFEKRLKYYCDDLPLDKAIMVVNEQLQQTKAHKKLLTEKLGYHLVLVISSLAVLMIFTNLVLPTMSTVLTDETPMAATMSTVFKVINVVKNIVIILFLSALGLLVYVKVRKRETYFWLFLHRYKLDGWLKIMITYRFTGRLLCLMQQGISLVEAIKIIRYKPLDRLCSLLAYHFDETLLKGTDFEESLDLAYFDDEFHSICLFGLKNDDFLQALADYKAVVEMKFQMMIKRCSNVLQAICYLFVVVVIVAAYCVLMLPLELLSAL